MSVVCWSRWCVQFHFLGKFIFRLNVEDECMYCMWRTLMRLPRISICIVFLLFAWGIYCFIAMSYHRLPRFFSLRTVSLNCALNYQCVTFVLLNHDFAIFISFWSQSYKNHISFIVNPKFMGFFASCSSQSSFLSCIFKNFCMSRF